MAAELANSSAFEDAYSDACFSRSSFASASDFLAVARSALWAFKIPPHRGSGFSRNPSAHYSILTKMSKNIQKIESIPIKQKSIKDNIRIYERTSLS